MKTTFLILFGLSFALLSCQKETIREVVYRNNEDGGIDGAGGGNGYCPTNQTCKPLESFRVDILKHTDYDLVKNLLLTLAKVFKPLAADMLHLLKNRGWYFVPGELNRIPSSRIGVAFATDQLALQNLREVWFNQLLYTPMETSDRKNLIVHELVMGLRLLTFSNVVDICIANATRELISIEGEVLESSSEYSKKYKECMNIGLPLGNNSHEQKIKLSQEDYANIRDFTFKIVSLEGNLLQDDWQTWLAKNGFRDYAQPE